MPERDRRRDVDEQRQPDDAQGASEQTEEQHLGDRQSSRRKRAMIVRAMRASLSRSRRLVESAGGGGDQGDAEQGEEERLPLPESPNRARTPRLT